MTQERLAELAGLNYKYIGRVELGKADPGADVLVRLARALMVPVGELFDTITPSTPGARQLPPAAVEQVTTALHDLTVSLGRLLGDTPQPAPQRSARRSPR